MKKAIVILITICLSAHSCSKSKNSSERKNHISEYGFNGNVKSVKSELFNLIPEKDTFKIGEKINGISIDRNELLEFNKTGNLTSSKEFLANGKVSDEIINTYDKNNKLTRRKVIDNYGKGDTIDYQYSYNSSDSLEQIIVLGKNFQRIHKIERDKKIRPIKNLIIQNDTILTTYAVEYDQNNNVITENEYKSKNDPVRLLKREFNEQKLKEKEQVIEYNTWDTINYENQYFYDSKQKLVLGKMFIENDSSYEEIKNSYHPNGELKESISTPMGSEYFVITSQKLDDKGHLIEHSRLPNDTKEKEIWEYKYKYDSEGNWIEKINYKNKVPLQIVKRKIEYY
ncbi:hypothetical protein [Abyssalbus ytuae]|uniref:YD repeat-containing protein n=1 Tax=Abyssalbus ytuae TaxID=2926907 RepID=A0A9E7D0R7_9FLAO|nr:hypothetical protein [Abyssalbus ytuae]UOB18670.1 hypothetical protein MQE35_05110 [Abyssalbus ytuae]